MRNLAATIATIWRLSVPYFRSEDRLAGCILLAAVIAIELSLVAAQVILNQWYNRFYNTLQDRNWDAFVSAILFFCVLASIYTVLVVYQTYLNQWLQIRWRRWMTQNYLSQWLNAANHYRMQLLGDAADNPDQRIADDLQMFVQYTLTITIGLLNSVVTLCSFIVILWTLSAHAPLHLFGSSFDIPGYLVWAALIYAVFGTVLTHLIGWRLIPLNFMQQRFEADFRFNLVRTRENSEQIAALDGEAAERESHLGRFRRVVDNWLALMQRQKQLMFFTQSYSQASVIFPYIVVSPAYFAGAMQLGGLMQTASAFNSVQNALSYFITAYRQIAEWRAIIARLSGFEDAIAAGRAAAVTPPAIEVAPRRRRGVCDRRPRCASAERRADRRRRARYVCARRAGAGDRTFRRRQVDAVPRHRRHLAVRLGPRDGAEGRQGDAGCRSGPIFRWRRSPRRSPIRGRPARSTMPASARR